MSCDAISWVKEESVTLHQVADTNMPTPGGCISVFENKCSPLGHVHLKGYLHNDLKASNEVLERISVSKELTPVVIDFGKSVKASSYSTKCYLAPEVRSEQCYSVGTNA